VCYILQVEIIKRTKILESRIFDFGSKLQWFLQLVRDPDISEASSLWICASTKSYLSLLKDEKSSRLCRPSKSPPCHKLIYASSGGGLRGLLSGNGLDTYIDNFERYGFDEESITAVELRDYDVLGIAGEDRQKLFKLIQR